MSRTRGADNALMGPLVSDDTVRSLVNSGRLEDARPVVDAAGERLSCCGWLNGVWVQGDGSLLDRTGSRVVSGWGTGFCGYTDDNTRELRFDDFDREFREKNGLTSR